MSESRIERQMREYRSEDKQIQKQAMAEIVQDHQKYISEIINRYFSAYKHDWYADMFQWGIVGLIESLPAYDPEKSKPTTFFHFYILHAISRFLAKYVQGVSIHYTTTLQKINKGISDLQSRGIEEPSLTDISVEVGMRVNTIKKMLEIKKTSQVHIYGDDAYLDSLVHDFQDSPEIAVEQNEKYQTLIEAISSLPKNEQLVLIYKYGLFDQPKLTNAQIAQKTGIPNDQIRACTNSAVQLLRRNPRLRRLFTDYAAKVTQEGVSFGETFESANNQMDDLVDSDEIEVKF